MKPCPFCGSEDIEPARRIDFPVAARCRACGAQGPSKLTGGEADAAWGDQTPHQIRSEVARLGTPDNPRFRVLWMNTLHDIAERRPGIPQNKLGQPVVSDFDKWIATDEEILAAWEKVKGKI